MKDNDGYKIYLNDIEIEIDDEHTKTKKTLEQFCNKYGFTLLVYKELNHGITREMEFDIKDNNELLMDFSVFTRSTTHMCWHDTSIYFDPDILVKRNIRIKVGNIELTGDNIGMYTMCCDKGQSLTYGDKKDNVYISFSNNNMCMVGLGHKWKNEKYNIL